MKIVGRNSNIAWPHLVVDDTYSPEFSSWLTSKFDAGRRKVLDKFSDMLNED